MVARGACRGRKKLRFFLIAACVAAVAAMAGASRGADPSPAPVAVRKQTRRVLKELASARWVVRQKAHEAILRLPGAAIPILEKALSDGSLGPGTAAWLRRDLPTIILAAQCAIHVQRAQAWAGRQFARNYSAPPGATKAWRSAARAVLDSEMPGVKTKATQARLRAAVRFLLRQPRCPDAVIALLAYQEAAEWPRVSAATLYRLIAYSASHMKVHRDSELAIFLADSYFARTLFQRDGGRADPLAARYEILSINAFYGIAGPAPQLVIRRLSQTMLHTYAKDSNVGSSNGLTTLGRTLDACAKRYYYTWLVDARRAASRYYYDGLNNSPKQPADLAIAKRDAAKAWRMAPYLVAGPLAMMKICSAAGLPAADFNLWYHRAKTIAPGDYDIYLDKLLYIESNNPNPGPAMLAFGRRCVARGHWRARIPAMLVAARVRLAFKTNNIYQYYARPGVWRDIHAVMSKLLRRDPNDRFDVNWYAELACKCGKWATAKSLFKRIGNRPNLNIFNSLAEFHYFRRKANRMAGANSP